MTSAFKASWATKERYGISLREAVYVYSVEKVVRNMKLKGKL